MKTTWSNVHRLVGVKSTSWFNFLSPSVADYQKEKREILEQMLNSSRNHLFSPFFRISLWGTWPHYSFVSVLHSRAKTQSVYLISHYSIKMFFLSFFLSFFSFLFIHCYESFKQCMIYTILIPRDMPMSFDLVGWLVGFYGISTFVGYLMPIPFLYKNQFYFKQFRLA